MKIPEHYRLMKTGEPITASSLNLRHGQYVPVFRVTGQVSAAGESNQMFITPDEVISASFEEPIDLQGQCSGSPAGVQDEY